MMKNDDSRIKFLIIGANGLIGEAVIKEIDTAYSWQGTYCNRQSEGLLLLDITRLKSLEDVFEKVCPTHVVHGANLAGSVPFCEKNPDDAKKFHFDGTVNIGECCRNYGAKLVFISSECVFDGQKDSYDESDQTCSINVYGKWKAESEAWIAAHLTQYVIIRTMSVFGWQPQTQTPNALMGAYFAISQKKYMHVSQQRWCSPTFVRDLAGAIAELSLSDKTGIFHVVGKSFLRRYDWLKKSCDYLGWDSSFLVLDSKTPSQDAPYPPKARFNTDKFSSTCQTSLHNLEDALELLKQEIDSAKISA